MKQVSKNPSLNKTITIESPIAFSSTGVDGLVTGTNFSTLIRGQRVRVTVTGGTAQGFTTARDYFVIPVSSTEIKLAESRSDALKSINITTTGNAGAGTLAPAYLVGGVLYVGTEGYVNIRGIDSEVFSVHKGLQGWVPPMVGEIHSVDTTATDIVGWEG